MAKERINLTIDPYCMNLIRQAQKLNQSKVSQSTLIEFAIKSTYKNKKEYLQEKKRELMKKYNEYDFELKELEKLETEGNENVDAW